MSGWTARDDAWLIAMYEKHAPWLGGNVARLARWNLSEADDFVQQTFEAVMRQPARPECDDEQRALLYQIARNKIVDALRSWTKRTKAERSAAQNLTLTKAPDSSQDIECRINQISAKHESEMLLQDLSKADRELLIMYYFMKMTGPEIAKVLGTTPGNTRQKILKTKKNALRVLRRYRRSGEGNGAA